MNSHFQVLVLLLWSALLFPFSAVCADEHSDLQIDWLRKNGGFWTSKMQVQPLDPNDPNSPNGVFALQDIEKGEKLIIIPQACLVTAGDSEETCDLARNLVKERKLGEESKYAPYVNYVFDPKFKGQLPASWSGAGKHLLETIVGKELPPYNLDTVSFEEKCGEEADALQEEAYLIVLRRSWDDVMVPLMDLLNHRNGKWHNTNSNSVHTGEDITSFASRDISKGEQLYLSYNECTDCHGYALTYVLPVFLRDYGFIEQYPRRWYIEGLAFELDEDEETKEVFIKFLKGEPDVKFMRAHLKRLRGMSDYVHTKAKKLDSAHERYMTVEYYNALMTALEYAVREGEKEDDEAQECSLKAGDSETCAVREYDSLETLPDKLEFNYEICDFERIQDGKYRTIDKTKSLYQEMVYEYSRDLDDTCLYMNGHLHACASFRPHYHEVFVHYPARFVDQVKRVAFIGGGDNMIVHEILKYPGLELAVGLELDQRVVRSSFKNFGTQPHFDDDRLQWWFGDGSKSILMLPEEYYGSFDVVYVDLQNTVVDFLKVANEFAITDAAMLLLKPDGVIVRNEDWEFGSNNPFTDYTVDMMYVDVPLIGYQQITVGSNAMNFLTNPPKDHGVSTIYMESIADTEDPFDKWINYKKSTNRTNVLCKEPGAPDKVLLTDELRSSLGLLLIIEAEDVSVPLEESSSVQGKVSQALKDSGLTELSVQVESDEMGYEIVYLLKEGYAVARVYPELSYCAFDLLLWSNTNKMDTAKAKLVAAVGSNSVSSFRVLTSGMFGVEDASHVGPRIKEPCNQKPVVEQDTPTEQTTIGSILIESLSLLQDKTAPLVVLCGKESGPCNSLELLKKTDAFPDVHAVWTCPALPANDASLEDMWTCESETLLTLQKELEEKKIGGIVIDSETPIGMGQILLKMFSDTSVQSNLLAENLVVLSATTTEDSSWRKILLDRFRTDIVRFDPAHRAQVSFKNTKLKLDMFVSGDTHFYTHLVPVLEKIKSKTNLAPQVENVWNGVNNYIADFVPSQICTHDDYSARRPLAQWYSQEPLETQTVYQLVYSKKNEKLDTASVKKMLQTWLDVLNADERDEELQVYDEKDVGDGSVIVSYWDDGSVVLVWDGKDGVSLNLVSSQSTRKEFEASLVKDKKWKLAARDEFPRGTGRVVNIRQDLEKRDEKEPHWAHDTKYM